MLFLNGFGVFVGCFFMFVGWLWDGCGMVLGWFWDGFGVDPGSFGKCLGMLWACFAHMLTHTFARKTPKSNKSTKSTFNKWVLLRISVRIRCAIPNCPKSHIRHKKKMQCFSYCLLSVAYLVALRGYLLEPAPQQEAQVESHAHGT